MADFCHLSGLRFTT